MPWYQVLGTLLLALVHTRPCSHRLHLGTNNFHETIESHTYSLSVNVGPYDSKCKGPTDLESWWGAISKPPKTVLSDIALYFDSSRISIPRVSFDYLAEPSCAQIVGQADGSTRLIVSGADAAASYTAEFKFVGGHLIERRIRSNEYPTEIYELTTYVNRASE